MLKLFPRSFILISVLIILISACAPSLKPPVSNLQSPAFQTPAPTNSSVKMVTFTPVPTGSYIGDAVPPVLRAQVDGLDARIDISSSIQSTPNWLLRSPQ
jgi:hypothetical protein